MGSIGTNGNVSAATVQEPAPFRTKKFQVKNKESGETYSMTVNTDAGQAYVLDRYGDNKEWISYKEDNESWEDFIKRAKRELRTDEDM